MQPYGEAKIGLGYMLTSNLANWLPAPILTTAVLSSLQLNQR